MSVSDFVAVKKKKKKIIVSNDIRVKNGGLTFEIRIIQFVIFVILVIFVIFVNDYGFVMA